MGLFVRLQQEGPRKLVEEKFIASHQGWRRRHSSSKEYELVNETFFSAHDQDDFWEVASRHIMSRYDIDENVMVVANGDRAEWIRKGVDYFPQAMYQIDRFHLKRELRRLFGKHPECLRRLYTALESNGPTGATFLACLAECRKLLRSKKEREAARKLLEDLATIPEAIADYRNSFAEERH